MKKQKHLAIYQDFNAVVSLVTKGVGSPRTKHLRTRMHLGKEMVDENSIVVKHMPAEEMQADGLSKLYDLVEHKPFAILIQGEAG
jgi:translation elongation factor EF-4